MKIELAASNIADLRAKFGNFHDAVIHQVQYYPFDTTNKVKMANIILGAKDMQRTLGTEWVNVTFEIQVLEIVLRKPVNYEDGIVFRLSIDFFDDEICLDFHALSKLPKTRENYNVYEAGKGSLLMVVGKRCFWSLSPYEELKANKL